jgi:hypothetical protein
MVHGFSILCEQDARDMTPDIDAEVTAGRLSRLAYQQLALAAGNGNASPMKWLGARLAHLRATIQSGRAVEISMPGHVLVITTLTEFDAWCEQAFPDAFSWFFVDRIEP